MTDYLIAECKSCGHHVRISLEHGGRRAKCPKCDFIIEIPKGETSIRLRSDRELTREARAKAGRSGPDTDHDESPAARSAGRHTTARIRRVVATKRTGPGRTWAMIATLVATAAIIAGIVLILFRKAPGDPKTAAPPAAPAGPAKKTPPPPPPAPPPDPNAAVRGEIMARLDKYVETFKSNNLNLILHFYTCDLTTLTKAFGKLPVDSVVHYSKHEVKSIEFSPGEIKMTLIVDRVLTDTEAKTSTTEEGVTRVLVWTQKEGQKDGKWVITSLPEP